MKSLKLSNIAKAMSFASIIFIVGCSEQSVLIQELKVGTCFRYFSEDQYPILIQRPEHTYEIIDPSTDHGKLVLHGTVLVKNISNGAITFGDGLYDVTRVFKCSCNYPYSKISGLPIVVIMGN